jgi:hypothetical protein
VNKRFCENQEIVIITLISNRMSGNYSVITDAASTLPILRPLKGYDKEDTVRLARVQGDPPGLT